MTLAQLLERFHVDSSESLEWQVKYNVAPTLRVPVVVELPQAKRKAMLMKWGLVPPWSKGGEYKPLVNLRSDTIQHKPGFTRLLKSARCIVPVDGYFEWKTEGKSKQPYRFVMKSNGLFGLGGLYGTISLAGGEVLYMVCLITTEANDVGQAVHDRMPVIIPPEKEDAWLNPSSKLADYVTCLAPYAGDRMRAYRVSPVMNSGKIDSPDCVVPLSS